VISRLAPLGAPGSSRSSQSESLNRLSIANRHDTNVSSITSSGVNSASTLALASGSASVTLRVTRSAHMIAAFSRSSRVGQDSQSPPEAASISSSVSEARRPSLMLCPVQKAHSLRVEVLRTASSLSRGDRLASSPPRWIAPIIGTHHLAMPGAYPAVRVK
jgi:hypothetical protein